MLVKDKQDMTGEFERTVNFMGDVLSNRETNHKFFKLNTCDDEADIETDENEPEGGPVTSNFTIDFFFRVLKCIIFLHPK